MKLLLMNQNLLGLSPWIMDFAVDSRFDCNVVLNHIYSEGLTVISNLLKVNQDKTHSVLSQVSTEKLSWNLKKEGSNHLNLEELLSDITSCNPSFLLIAGGFNTRTLSWWWIDSTTSEGTRFEVLTCSDGLSQITSSRTCILQNSCSCIELISLINPTS